MANIIEKYKNWLIYLSLMILLEPVLFFPIATDTAIFVQAGKIITQGGLPYVNFIDIKPPFIYYIFAFISAIFGTSEFGIHLFDFIIQSLTAILIFKLIGKSSKSRLTGYLGACLYAITYTIMGHNQTMQVESYVPILTIGIIWLSLKKGVNFTALALAGLLAGLVTGLKFTMGIILLYQIFYDLLSGERESKVLLKRTLYYFLGFAAGIIITYLPFILSGQVREGFANVYQYLNIYSQSTVFGNVFRDSLKTIANIFGDKLSLLFTCSILLGLLWSLRKFKESDDEERSLFTSTFVLLILLSISIIVEKKFFLYHFERLFGVYVIFGAFGLNYLFVLFKRTWGDGLTSKGIIISTLVFFLFFSPIPRWINLITPSYYFLADKEKYELYYNREETQAILMKEHKDISAYFLNNSKPQEKAMVVSIASSILNYYIGEKAGTKYLLSCFYINKIEIPLWRKEAYKELNKADWLIIQVNDPTPIANGHNQSSWEYMSTNPLFSEYINMNFGLVKEFKNFLILRRSHS